MSIVKVPMRMYKNELKKFAHRWRYWQAAREYIIVGHRPVPFSNDKGKKQTGASALLHIRKLIAVT